MLHTYRLPGALPGEKVISVIHRDPFIAVRIFLLFGVLIFLPLGGLIMLNNFFPTLMQTVLIWPLLLISASSYLLFIWLFFFFSLIDYFLDVWVITDSRVIEVHQDGFFSRSISEVPLSQIQDIKSEINGFLQTILKYGNVIVQTASERNALFFEEVSHPDKVRDTLMRLAHQKNETPKV